MPFCRNCGVQMQEEDRFCKGCGAAVVPTVQPAYPVGTAQQFERAFSPGFIWGQVVSIVGASMLVIGPFLAFITVYLLSQIDRSGVSWTNNEALVIVGLGILGVAFGVVSLILKRRFTGVPFLVGIVSLGFTIWYYVQARDLVAEAVAEDYVASVGTGLYLCLIGGIICLVGGIVSAVSKKV
jgi:hypothetical protein